VKSWKSPRHPPPCPFVFFYNSLGFFRSLFSLFCAICGKLLSLEVSKEISLLQATDCMAVGVEWLVGWLDKTLPPRTQTRYAESARSTSVTSITLSKRALFVSKYGQRDKTSSKAMLEAKKRARRPSSLRPSTLDKVHVL